MKPEHHDVVGFPHFFSETIRVYRHTSVVILNTVTGNVEQFIKRNFRVRLVTNTVFPGAYEYDLALIENDRFLLTNVDLRRIQQLAEAMDFQAGGTPTETRGGVSLPGRLWAFVSEARQLPLYDRTPYHRASVNCFLWQLCKYYLQVNSGFTPSLPLAEAVRFYVREVRRTFRSNREVNESHLRIDRDALDDIAARILIVDIPPVSGYRKLPLYLHAREVLVNENFRLESVLPADYFLGSPFSSQHAYLEWLQELLSHCRHMEFWLMILRDPGLLPELNGLLAGMGRRGKVFSRPIAGGFTFDYLLAQEG